MRTYYRKSFEVVGWTFHADIYCAECGDALPEVDPEGNERHPVFLDELDGLREFSCGECGTGCEVW